MNPSVPWRVHAQWLGRQPYQAAWDLQRQLAQAIELGQHPPALLLLEHPHTYTIGGAGGTEHLLWDDARLELEGVDVHHVDRGGDITYHGPGQLVGYPVLPLGRVDSQGHLPQADYIGYLRQLEQVLIDSLGHFGVSGTRRSGLTGVWVAKPSQDGASGLFHKIASIGVKVNAAGITQHGFALNLQPDMRYWSGIIACGIRGAEMTSLAQLLGDSVSIEAAARVVQHQFARVFGCQMHQGLLLPAPPA